MKKARFFHIFLFTCMFCSATEKETFIVIGSPLYNPGMFSVLHTVIGTLDLYETKGYAGVEVDFGTSGIYYEPKKGANWWSYFLEPLQVGTKGGKKVVPYRFIKHCQSMAFRSEFNLDKFRSAEIVLNYFQFKPFLIQMVHDFANAHFKGKRVIGIHYRGTDKKLESPRVPFKTVLKTLKNELRSNDVIFVATDELDFLNFIQEKFPEQIVFIPASRSSNGKAIHYGENYSNVSHYQLGLEAMLDAHLLSMCDLLIRTSSNLSLFSTYLNPNMPTIALNERHQF